MKNNVPRRTILITKLTKKSDDKSGETRKQGGRDRWCLSSTMLANPFLYSDHVR